MPGWIAGSTVSGVASTADRSLTFVEDNIQVWGSSVRRLVIGLAGTNMTMANIARITLKTKSQLRIDAPPIHIAALLGFYGKKAEWASTVTRFTIPLDFFLGLGADPSGKLRLEIEKNATPSGTITAQMHQYVDEVSPVNAYGQFLSTTQGLVAASASAQPLSLSGSGVLMGLTVPDVANVTMLRVKQKGTIITEFMSSAAIIEAAQLQRGTTSVTEVYVPITPIEITPDTLIQVSTGAGYTPGEWGQFTVQQY